MTDVSDLMLSSRLLLRLGLVPATRIVKHLARDSKREFRRDTMNEIAHRQNWGLDIQNVLGYNGNSYPKRFE